ncbi:hypothetical protein SAY86_016935 [Trapa natans]|uniref:MLO-like protein n=1 Tax=Trapa natans TaxID=22666 RepID=A0AAN7R6Y4_TRANT|nr:hypothetical protein SAY86_016935 [Trapa natans]
MAGGGTTLEQTPTWVVAAVCSVIVAISLAVERVLHATGKYLKKKNQKSLFESLLKIKEELMLLGFISLLLTVFQSRISEICISREASKKWLPCKEEDSSAESTTSHFQAFFSSPGLSRRLLAEASSDATSYCDKKGMVPLLSTTALHHLHIFIFVLAVTHVTICALTILFGGAKISQWKKWEDDANLQHGMMFTKVKDHAFIRSHFLGVGKLSLLLGWIHSFFKQFYSSVTKSDYTTLRLGFIMTHCRGNPKFNFHRYMVRALEADFKKVVGISWYLWVFLSVFLLLNVSGWHAYFYVSLIPAVLLLAVGTKLEHVLNQLAHEVAEKHEAVEGDLVVQPSDDHFWFHRPKMVLLLIHIILFQNSFELAFFFFILVQYKFSSCIMGPVGFVIPRLVIGVLVQFLCSYSTLPLYAIVTQMGSSFKKAIFDEHVQQGISVWAKHAKMNKKKEPSGSNNTNQSDPSHPGEKEAEMTLCGQDR